MKKSSMLMAQKASSEIIRSAIQELSNLVKADDHHLEYLISTKPFLNICNLVLQVLDKIGPTMAVLRQDVHQNIQRLEELYQSDPSTYANLSEIVKKEVEDGSAKKAMSSTRALLWLTRALDFTVALLDKIAQDPSQSLAKVVEISYDSTLRLWHGWISSAAYKVALKLVPENKAFIGILQADDQEEAEECNLLHEEIQKLVSLLLPLLDQVHRILETFHLNRLKST